MELKLELAGLPTELGAIAATRWENILERADAGTASELAEQVSSGGTSQLARVLACSPFAAGLCRSRPGLLLQLLQNGSLQRSLGQDEILTELRRALAESGATIDDRQAVIEQIRDLKVKSIFVETSLNRQMIEAIAKEAGVQVGGELYSDAMGAPGSAGESYIGMMRENTLVIAKGLK